jgi:GNAT superfamily N-acetyltransferase
MFDKTGESLRTFQRTFLGHTKVEKEPGVKTTYTTDEALLHRFHEEIIQQCFDKDDSGPVEELVDEVLAGEGVVLLTTEGTEILGGVVISHYWSTGKKIMLVSWLGVDEKHRSRNIGSLLIEEALSYARANGALVLLGEVEDPNWFKETESAHGDPAKRVKFYSRFDCKKMEVPCYIPAFYDHQEPIFGVMLSLFPLSEEQKTATEMFLPELPVFVEELMGQDTDQESLDFVEACRGPVALTPFRTLF